MLHSGDHRAMRFLRLAFLLPAAASAAASEPQLRLEELTVRSPYRIPASAGTGVLRYRLRIDGAPWFLPETGEQHVEPDGDGWTLTICHDCGREAPPDVATLKRLRQPNAWVESGDRALRAFARAAGTGTLHARMDRLTQAVRRRLDGPVDYTNYLSASEAYDARRGDCTEYALLLAAAARAAGLPARVAVGLAYGSRFVGVAHAFGPHAWVQVWDGKRWVSFDAGLPMFDARHLALAVGDGSPERFGDVMALIGRIEIVDAARVEASEPAR